VRNSTFDSLSVDSFVHNWPDGLVLACNSDYRRSSSNNEVMNCSLDRPAQGIAIVGSGNYVHDNFIDLITGVRSPFGILILTLGNAAGTWESRDNRILNNRILRSGAGNVKGYGTWLRGQLYGGEVLESAGNEIKKNQFGENIYYGALIDNYARNNVFQCNRVSGPRLYADIYGGTASGNVIEEWTEDCLPMGLYRIWNPNNKGRTDFRPAQARYAVWMDE
jgi:hypothetical protein